MTTTTRTPYLVALQQLKDAAMDYAIIKDDRALRALKQAAEDYAEASIRTGLGSAERSHA